jgi:cytochrome c nitrite reductase small subunit
MGRRWKFEAALVVLGGIVAGLGCYTFVYAKGYSYLLNDPSACANCHVMRDYLDGWVKSSHRSVAACNDCHTPHDFAGKYSTKALNGFFHSLAFTSGRFPDVIEIKERNRGITEAACRHCHENVVLAMDGRHQAQKVSCLRCHATVGHL